MQDDVIAMQLTCSGCGRTVANDLPRSQMPDQLAFLERLRAAGWHAMHHHGSDANSGRTSEKRLCPKCASSS
jgi:ribosomal protein S27AE